MTSNYAEQTPGTPSDANPTPHTAGGPEQFGASLPFPKAGKASELREPKPANASLKHALIEEVCEYNTTASREFLARFTNDQLRAYLEHLKQGHSPRGTKPWIRPAGQPAVVSYRPTA